MGAFITARDVERRRIAADEQWRREVAEPIIQPIIRATWRLLREHGYLPKEPTP